MFESSKDILYLVIAFCVLWVTVFLCWMFYYVMRLLRNANEIVEEFRTRLEALMELVHNIHGKVEKISSLITLATEGAGGLVKKMLVKKTSDWLGKTESNFNGAAKEAVGKAVSATAKKMKKVTKKIKK